MTGMEIIGLFGSAVSFITQMSAAGDQKAIAAQQEELAIKNAANIEAEGREEARRLGLEQEQAEGLTRAKIAASGATAEGSTGSYMDNMAKEHEKEMDWLKKSTASQADIAKSSGSITAQTTLAKASATEMGAVTSVFGDVSSIGKSAGWFAT